MKRKLRRLCAFVRDQRQEKASEVEKDKRLKA